VNIKKKGKQFKFQKEKGMMYQRNIWKNRHLYSWTRKVLKKQGSIVEEEE